MRAVDFKKKLGGYLALLTCCVTMIGCGPNAADAEETAAQGGEVSTPQDILTDWPTTEEAGRIRQVIKHVEALDVNPTLVLMSDLPGGEMPAWDIGALGVRRVQTEELEQLVNSGRWALVDVRKDKDITKKGTIPGSYHFEYKYEGAQYTDKTRLTREGIQSLLKTYDGVVLFCNGPKCSRSFNGCIQLVQGMKIDGKRVRWYRLGVPGWTQSPLIPMARTSPDPTTHEYEEPDGRPNP